jgi:hypothetical protein
LSLIEFAGPQAGAALLSPLSSLRPQGAEDRARLFKTIGVCILADLIIFRFAGRRRRRFTSLAFCPALISECWFRPPPVNGGANIVDAQFGIFPKGVRNPRRDLVCPDSEWRIGLSTVARYLSLRGLSLAPQAFPPSPLSFGCVHRPDAYRRTPHSVTLCCHKMDCK